MCQRVVFLKLVAGATWFMMFVLLRGAVWAERRAVNLAHDAFHVSDDGKFCCC